MNFELTEEQKIIQDTAAKFAKRELVSCGCRAGSDQE